MMPVGYEVRYIDGRNHALDLVSSFVKKMRKKKKLSKKELIEILSDREWLEQALWEFNPGYFNDYNEEIGPTTS